METILLYLLQKKDRAFTTTKRQFFKAIGAIPKDYAEYPTYKYLEETPLKGIVSYKELDVCHNLFSEIIHERLNKILKPTLKYLQDKGAVRVVETVIIVANTVEGTKHVPIDNTYEMLGLKPTQVKAMIEDANEAALNQIYIYDENAKKEIPLTSFEEVSIHHKRKQFKKQYEAFIQDNYGWSYTYEEMVFSIPEGVIFQEVSAKQYIEAKCELNELLVDAIRKTINTKNEGNTAQKRCGIKARVVKYRHG